MTSSVAKGLLEFTLLSEQISSTNFHNAWQDIDDLTDHSNLATGISELQCLCSECFIS